MQNSIVLLGSIWILLLLTGVSCSVAKRPFSNTNLEQQITLAYLEDPSTHQDVFGKGKIQIDPILEVRKSLESNGVVYFNDPLRSSLLKTPVPDRKARVVIPDSLKYKYTYLEDRSDMEHNYAVIHHFSMLLPTDIPDTYLMEHIEWLNLCVDSTCGRMLKREFIQVALKKGAAFDISIVNIYEQTDLIAFGFFNQEQLDKAKPGKKLEFKKVTGRIEVRD